MPVYRLDDSLRFPPASHAEPDGLLAVGGDLRPERLILAYASGIFPWYSEEDPILWYSPDPRMVIRPKRLHVPRRLERRIRGGGLVISFDQAFEEVISACAIVPRRGEDGTWITDAMIEAYVELHRRGIAHSLEVRRGGALVGGIYGLSLGGFFAGESMFRKEADASKIALVSLVRRLADWDFDFLDCQLPAAHLGRLGAEEVPRDLYLARLERTLLRKTRKGPWS
jgi:leucyl/phenylalanyl-tRNA--protein transferase